MFYSSDSGILSREVDNLRRRLNMSLDDTINYDINSVSDIVNEASTIGMFSLNKFIVINIDSYFKDKKDIPNINLLEEYFDSYNPNSYLIFIFNSDTIDSRK